jgi:LysM repeat protein
MLRQKTAPSRVLVIISTIVVALVLLLPSTGHADGVEATTIHQVRAGDSLWTIAQAATEPGADVRLTIEAIRQINDLSGSVIVPGQRLEVPVFDATG